MLKSWLSLKAPRFRNLFLRAGRAPTSDSLPNWVLRALVQLDHGGRMGSLGLKHDIVGSKGWEFSQIQLSEIPRG